MEEGISEEDQRKVKDIQISTIRISRCEGQ